MTWLGRDRKAAPAVAARGSIEIREPRARPLESDASKAGAFAAITNKGPESDRLIAASSPAAEKIEIHAIKVVGADLMMQELANGLGIPADNTMTLKPRGYHLLLLGLKVRLSTGGRLPVTLTFEKAGDIDIELPIEAPGLVGNAILDENPR